MAKKAKYTQCRKPQKGGGKTRKTRTEAITLLKETYSPTTAKNIVQEWTKSKRSIDKKYPNKSSSEKKEDIKRKFAQYMGELGYNVTLKNKSKLPKPKSPKSSKTFLRKFSNKK